MQLCKELGSALSHLQESCNCTYDFGCSRGLPELCDLALEYSWEEIESATDSFCVVRRLGRGSYGSVYRGNLREGTGVAIKVIELQVGGGFEEEVRLLSLCRHPNVVMLLGFSRVEIDLSITPGGNNNPCRRALVYELLHGGDLCARLRSQSESFMWRDRVRAAIDVSRGLAHLHKHRPKIFHRDIKSQNILFTADGTAKIADFGLACASKQRDAEVLLLDVLAGTVGYVDPLYAQTGVISEATEMYSFGVVVLEILTGRPPVSRCSDSGGPIFFLDIVRPCEDQAKHRILKRLDAKAHWSVAVAASLATLALLCIHNDEDRRPTFLEVASLLQDLAGDLVERDPYGNDACLRSLSQMQLIHPTTAGAAVGDSLAIEGAHERQHLYHPCQTVHLQCSSDVLEVAMCRSTLDSDAAAIQDSSSVFTFALPQSAQSSLPSYQRFVSVVS